MTGFGGLDGGLERKAVAHFADQDHIRVFAHHGPDAVLKRIAVQADLALVDERLFVHVGEFDRIFDRHDMHVLALIDLFEHGRDRRGFARAGDAGEDNQPLLAFGDFGEDFGQMQLVITGNLRD